MPRQQEANVNAQVGELVHSHMWRAKLTQTKLAQHLGVSQPAVAKKLRGERPFSIDELLAIAAYLNLPITELLPNAENPRPGGPDGGNDGLGIKSPKLYQLSYRGTHDDSNAPHRELETVA